LGLGELVTRQSKVFRRSELNRKGPQPLEAHNPKIKCLIYKMYEQARKKPAQGAQIGPDGAFKGVPFLQNDMHATVEGVGPRAAARAC